MRKSKIKLKKKGNKKPERQSWVSPDQIRGGGRPPKFDSVDDLNDAILKYLEYCLKSFEMPNKAGLCLSLGIVKDTYCEWKKKGHRFADSIKRFENVTESRWVQRLGGNSPTGAIFYLKNAFKEDYKDRHEHGGDKDSPLVVKILKFNK